MPHPPPAGATHVVADRDSQLRVESVDRGRGVPYMTCTKCGLSVQLRVPYLTLDRCPRCIAKRGVSVSMVIAEDRPTSGSGIAAGAARKLRLRVVPGELKIETTRDRETLTLALRGELDLASAPALKRELHNAQASGAERIVVDLGELEFMDSAGFHVLLDAHQRLRAEQRSTLVLRRGRRSIMRVFELTSTDFIFQFEAARPSRRWR
jgi:anti-sigma B factor antagonist